MWDVDGCEKGPRQSREEVLSDTGGDLEFRVLTFIQRDISNSFGRNYEARTQFNAVLQIIFCALRNNLKFSAAQLSLTFFQKFQTFFFFFKTKNKIFFSNLKN